MVLAGAALVLAAWPVGYIAAVFSGGGHGSPFDGDWVEAVWGAALLAIPVLMIAIGIACFAATTQRRLRIAGLVALTIPLDFAVIAGAMWQMSRPDPLPIAHPVSPPMPDPTKMKIVAADGPTHVGIACSVTGDECVTTTTTYTATGKTTRRTVEKITSPAKR